jgi:hypothetical protein
VPVHFSGAAIYATPAIVTLVVTPRGSIEAEIPLHRWDLQSAPERIRTSDLRFRGRQRSAVLLPAGGFLGAQDVAGRGHHDGQCFAKSMLSCPTKPVCVVTDRMGAAHDLEPAVSRGEDGAERSDGPAPCADGSEREVEPLDVGVLGRNGDVEVGGGAPPPVDLGRDPAHDHELNAVVRERPQQLGLVGRQRAHEGSAESASWDRSARSPGTRARSLSRGEASAMRRRSRGCATGTLVRSSSSTVRALRRRSE